MKSSTALVLGPAGGGGFSPAGLVPAAGLLPGWGAGAGTLGTCATLGPGVGFALGLLWSVPALEALPFAVLVFAEFVFPVSGLAQATERSAATATIRTAVRVLIKNDPQEDLVIW